MKFKYVIKLVFVTQEREDIEDILKSDYTLDGFTDAQNRKSESLNTVISNALSDGMDTFNMSFRLFNMSFRLKCLHV